MKSNNKPNNPFKCPIKQNLQFSSLVLAVRFEVLFLEQFWRNSREIQRC